MSDPDAPAEPPAPPPPGRPPPGRPPLPADVVVLVAGALVLLLACVVLVLRLR